MVGLLDQLTTSVLVYVSLSAGAMVGRRVDKFYTSREQSEGVGARVRRSIGRHDLPNLDPFLLFDEVRTKAGSGAGFPDHPHRGFETVSYVLEGIFDHEDSAGNVGQLQTGDVQWMTAGRGVVHCEMPRNDRDVWGTQLWVNLPKKDKMTAPTYQELKSSEVPVARGDKVSVKVISGECLGVKAAIRNRTPVTYLDVRLQAGGKFSQPIEAGWNVLVYILSMDSGFEARFGAERRPGQVHQAVLFEQQGDTVDVETTVSSEKPSNASDGEVRFLLVAGKPLNEPVVQYGLFVMNTQEEVRQAYDDFERGRNGFENAPNWKSRYVRRRDRGEL